MEAQHLFTLCVFIFTIGVSLFQKVDGHVCIPKEKIDPFTRKLRWSVLRAERCQCQAVVVPRNIASNHQACNKNDDKELWYFDDIQPLKNRSHWTKQKLDDFLHRAECYVDDCESDPCLNEAVCHDRVGRYLCHCKRGFEGINCEIDIEAPLIACPDNVSTNTDLHRDNATVFYNVSATDNSGNISEVSCSRESGSQFEIGETNVICQAEDEAGNAGTCSFNVDVKDTEAPIIICPGNISINTNLGSARATAFYNVEAMDNSDINPNMSCSHSNGSQLEIGDTNVTCEAIDGAGNAAQCMITIHVKDAEAPNITCRDHHQKKDKIYYTVEATDNIHIGDIAVNCSKADGATLEIDDTNVTCTATDDAGNSAECLFSFEVQAYHLGMGDKTIKNYQITSSSSYSSSYPPYFARLYWPYSKIWYPASNDSSPWIQVMFETNVTIEAVETKGRGPYVKSLQIQTGYSEQMMSYIMNDSEIVEFTANSDMSSIATIVLPERLCLSHIRIHPKTWEVVCALRFELLGFRECSQK